MGCEAHWAPGKVPGTRDHVSIQATVPMLPWALGHSRPGVQCATWYLAGGLVGQGAVLGLGAGHPSPH